MKYSTERIPTTHTGSLPRPAEYKSSCMRRSEASRLIKPSLKRRCAQQSGQRFVSRLRWGLMSSTMAK